MRESIPLTINGCTFELPAAEARLGNLAYWRENFQKSAKQDVETYLGRQAWDEQEGIMTLAKEFHQEGKPLAPTVSLIPVAAHQESQRIFPTMAEFAKQKADEPLSILMYMNMPSGTDHDGAVETMSEVFRAKKAFPELDIRASDIYEFDNPIIGKIRKDLWDAAVYLAYFEGAFDDSGDVIGFNHDIDIESISSGFVHNVQKYYEKRRTNAAWARTDHIKPAGTQMRHAYDPVRPNASKVVRWHDISVRTNSPSATFEAGLVLPFSSYVRAGGFSGDATTHETGRITLSQGLSPRIKHTSITTSPRRFGDRLHHTGIAGIWTPDSFGSDDNCRTERIAGDISDNRVYEILDESLQTHMSYMFNNPIQRYLCYLDEHDIENKLQKRKDFAMAVLKHLEPTGDLAETVDKRYIIADMVDDLKRGRFPTTIQNKYGN